jgi:hypothetical protein
MNDGDEYGTTFNAGTTIVPVVEITSPFDRTYKVVVSIITVYDVVGMLAIDDGTGYYGMLDGIYESVSVENVPDIGVTGDEILENGTEVGISDHEITTKLG